MMKLQNAKHFASNTNIVRVLDTKLFEEAIQLGDFHSIIELALMEAIQRKYKFKHDLNKAKSWLNKLQEIEHIYADFAFGRFYELIDDKVTANNYFRKGIDMIIKIFIENHSK